MAAIMARQCPGQKFLLLVHNPDTILSPPPGNGTIPSTLDFTLS